MLFVCLFKLMKGKALRKHSLHEKTTASVLLKLIFNTDDGVSSDFFTLVGTRQEKEEV